MFLIHKSKSRNIEKRFGISVIDIADDIKQEFESTIKEALRDVIKNYQHITTFSDPQNSNEYTTMRKTLFPELRGLLTELDNQEDLNTEVDFEAFKDKSVYCFQLKIPDQRLFIFANVGKNKITDKKYIIAKFKDKKLQQITDDIGIFEKKIFCIYYNSVELLLILDYDKTKKLLGFAEQFQNESAGILSEDLAEMIEYSEANLGKILANKQTNELMVKMKNNGIFENKHKDHFKKWNAFYEENPLENVEKLTLNKENKPVVKNAKDIAMVLYVANNDLMHVNQY